MTISTSTSSEVLSELSGRYQLDLAHSRVGFCVRHLLVARVHGWFGGVTGQVELDGDDPTKSSVALTIDPTTINTNNVDRDAHLRSPDFFDVERFPTIAFTSTAITDRGRDRYGLDGDLTIKGITRAVRLAVTYQGTCVDPYGQVRVGVSGSGSVKRSDWGLTWNQPLAGGGVVVSDRIELELDVSAIKVA